jgi:rusticyanin
MKKLILAVALIAGLTAAANGYAMGHGYGYGGYGMMGGGMMGNYGGWQGARQVTASFAEQQLSQTTTSAYVNKAGKTVRFPGNYIHIAMAAVQPNFPDTTFEVAGLVDPTLIVPAGSLVTLNFINMDYGYWMNHGVVITPIPPPYPVLSMMGMPDTVAGIPVLPPRQLKDTDSSRYMEGTTTFRAPTPGVYYYLCEFYNHAYKGMFGRFIVTQ